MTPIIIGGLPSNGELMVYRRKRRSTRLPRAVSVLAACVVVAAMVTACGGSDPPSPPPDSVGARGTRVVPKPVQDIVFTTAAGSHTTLKSLRGKVVVLTDFITLCGEQCPMTSANVNRMAHIASEDGLGDRVAFVEVTVDPHRDTTARLAAYRRLYGPARNWLLLRTSPVKLKEFCKFFGIFYKKTKEDDPPDHDWLTGKPLTYDVAHQDALIFLDTHGRERYVISGDANTGGRKLPATVMRFMNREGKKNLAHPGPLSWTVPQGLQVISWLLGRSVEAPT